MTDQQQQVVTPNTAEKNWIRILVIGAAIAGIIGVPIAIWGILKSNPSIIVNVSANATTTSKNAVNPQFTPTTTGTPFQISPTPNSNTSSNPQFLNIIGGMNTFGPAIWNHHFDANFTVENVGNYSFALKGLYIGIQGPHGENVDLGSDNVSTSILPKQTRQIYLSTEHLASTCNSCGAGTYRVFAEILLPDNTLFSCPPAAARSSCDNLIKVIMPDPQGLVITNGIYTYGPVILGDILMQISQ